MHFFSRGCNCIVLIGGRNCIFFKRGRNFLFLRRVATLSFEMGLQLYFFEGTANASVSRIGDHMLSSEDCDCMFFLGRDATASL